MEQTQIELASRLAKEWMITERHGSTKRAGWEHPQDLVIALRNLHEQVVSNCPECGGGREVDVSLGACFHPSCIQACGSCESRDKLYAHAEAVAWLHDVIEDGRFLVNKVSSVCWEYRDVKVDDLLQSGVEEAIVTDVVHLTNARRESKVEYLGRVRDGVLARVIPESVALVKIVDRICNLREGASVYSSTRWARVVSETREFIVPLLERVGRGESRILGLYLESAIAKGEAIQASRIAS